MKIYTYWRSLATFRVRIALNLKGLAPEQIQVNLEEGEQHKPGYTSVNPQMALPSLVLDDGSVLFQSLAILEYLNEVYPEPPLLPSDPKGRARVRALSLITVADSHPLIVPRVRNYVDAKFGVGEEGKGEWARHWFARGLDFYEGHLARDTATGATGSYCHGNTPTMADLCLASHCAGYVLFKGSLDGHPTVKGIYDRCMADDRFARAHPLRQPGAPKPA